MYEKWTVPSLNDTIPPGVYDLRIHIAGTDLHPQRYSTARVSVPGICTVNGLDEVLTRNYSGRKVSVIKIQVVPLPPADSVTLSLEDYATLMTWARERTGMLHGTEWAAASALLDEIEGKYRL